MPTTAPGHQALRGVTAARVAAADIMSDLREGRLLDAAFDRYALGLDARDRRWTQELTWGSLRRRERLDAALRPRVRGGIARINPDLVDILRLGVYQLLFMGSVPAYAAIGQTVELVKQRHGIGASRLANAVLRRIDRERDQLHDDEPAGDVVDSLAREHSHPLWLVERWVAQFGPGETASLLAANNQEAPVILRPWRVTRAALDAELRDAGVDGEAVPLDTDAIRLPAGTALLELGAWRRGHCFVQDPAATLVTRYAAMPTGVTVADACAAPGGKSLEMSRTAGFVVAGDRSVSRLARLADNIERLHADRVGLVAMDATAPAIRPVEALLLDAPCTGTGTFRRHPDARWRLRISDLAVLAATQSSMLRAAADHVQPGGLLVYSTCSIEPEENDGQVDDFLESHPGWSVEPPPSGAVPDDVMDAGRLRVLPQRHGTDGAFAARLRRAA
jgi:16S rRNA (cytosine967-C5)-methyltransferase